MTIENKISFVTSELQKINHANPANEAEKFLCFVLDMNWSDLFLKKNQKFPQEKKKLFIQSLERLKNGEPLAYIRGYQDFYKFQFKVNSAVLIPRPETELIVEKCLEKMSGAQGVVFDLGCGSGCIGLSVAKENKNAKVCLFDLSQEALDIAKQNSQTLDIHNIKMYCGEVGSTEFSQPTYYNKIDFILANPPYISREDRRVSESVHAHEPHLALYADNKGMNWIHKWLAWSYDYLKKDGFGIFEFGAGQTKDVVAAVESKNYKVIEVIKDYSGQDRLILFQK